ncbi:Tripartite-type tricarboxylate transporter, receptor component TctC [Noviherbaspirillum humi]|uniref:Tripartite-type tricarboxylate transporter, receptor component TctC n=1 Tax=Noviherbaspirillum humi TaxID=1688639 RepID=A0A239IT29_9BURK|nr:tripartite tricarboxylate transporter substrate binding protein [Noviherbaspirillum humi]SNS96542.1 Tripartite-type tricarboxylate transporter, receptor component TctC [Noviherbaspirillum humi]
MQKLWRFSLRNGGAILTLAATLTGICAGSAFAAYPEKLVKIVVPFAPGGGTDLIARALATEMSRDLGQSVIVENKPGAGTIIGTEAVAKSAPDGYTLLMATFAHAVNPGMQAKLPYATDKAFAPVVLIGRSPNILVVKSESPYKSVQDIAAAARAKPGSLTYASQGNGTSAHLAGELFKNLAKVSLTHVPYKGAGPALTDLLGGQVDMMFGTAAAVTPFIQSGKLRALGVTTAQRSPAYPNVPTIAESGVAEYAAESWYGLYAPAGTPPDVIARINAATKKATQSDAFRKRAQEEGLIVNAGAPAELDAYVRGEEARWRKIVKESNITAN